MRKWNMLFYGEIVIFVPKLSPEAQFGPWTIKLSTFVLQQSILDSISSVPLDSTPRGQLDMRNVCPAPRSLLYPLAGWRCFLFPVSSLSSRPHPLCSSWQLHRLGWLTGLRRRLSPSLSLSLSIRSVEWLTVLAGGSGAGRAAVTCRGRASPATIIQKVRRSFPCLPAGRKRAPPSYAFGSDPITVYTCVVSTEASAPKLCIRIWPNYSIYMCRIH